MGLGSSFKKLISKAAPIVSTVAPFFGPVGQGIGLAAGVLGGLTAPDQEAAAAAQADPFAGSRGMFQQQLQQALASPEGLANLPAVQAGTRIASRQASAQGFGRSGNLLAELQQVGQETAGAELERTARLAGFGSGGPGTAAQYTSNIGKSKEQSLGDLASLAPTIMNLFKKKKPQVGGSSSGTTLADIAPNTASILKNLQF